MLGISHSHCDSNKPLLTNKNPAEIEIKWEKNLLLFRVHVNFEIIQNPMCVWISLFMVMRYQSDIQIEFWKMNKDKDLIEKEMERSRKNSQVHVKCHVYKF